MAGAGLRAVWLYAATMGEYAPQALWDCFYTVEKYVFTAEMSGIIGDSSHTYGYHRGRAFVASNDYSVADYEADRKGSSQAANGLDISMGSSDMKTVTRRLHDAVDSHDSRLRGLRSFYGTTDGYNVSGREVPTGEWVTSDDSHLWHVHLSGFRERSEDHQSWQDIASVMIGQTLEEEDLTPDEHNSLKAVESLTRTIHNWTNNLYSAMFLDTGNSLPHGKSLLGMTGDVYNVTMLENAASPGKQPFTHTEANTYAAMLLGGSDMPDGKSVAQLLGEQQEAIAGLTKTVNELAVAIGVPQPKGKHERGKPKWRWK